MKRQKSQIEIIDECSYIMNGTKYWYDSEGNLHRIDGPAIVYSNGRTEYWQHGRLHRDDGPAIECADCSIEYWLYGKKTTEEAIELLQNVMKLKGI